MGNLFWSLTEVLRGELHDMADVDRGGDNEGRCGRYHKTRCSWIKALLGHTQSLRLTEVRGISLKGDLASLLVTIFGHV